MYVKYQEWITVDRYGCLCRSIIGKYFGIWYECPRTKNERKAENLRPACRGN